MTEKKLFLLDAYALIFRAYYALIKMPRITQSGFNTSAIYGFVNTLEEVLRKENPTHIAVCFDPPGPTFRSEAYEEYKGEREATPEDIKLSVPIIKEILEAYRIPVLECEGYEADDVIGTMATRAAEEGFTAYMMTPDKDFGQLVAPNILQYKPSYRGQDFELRGEEEVCARYGLVRTSQVIDLLALMGDKIDNIPGCPGVGEKTAVKLINEFDDVENLLANTDKLRGALKKKVEENAEQIRFSRYLATIKTDVPVDATPDSLRRQTPDADKLMEIFRRLEFKTLIDRVGRRLGAEAKSASKPAKPAPAPGTVVQPGLFDADFADEPYDLPVAEPAEIAAADLSSVKVETVADADALRRFQEAMLPLEEVGVRTVSEGENDMEAEWTGTAFSGKDGEGWFVPRAFAEGHAAVLDLFARGDIHKITSTAKRDYVLAERCRRELGNGSVEVPALANYFDTSLAHYLLQPEMRHDTANLTEQYLHISLPPAPVESKRKNAPKPSAGEVASRACLMAEMDRRLREPLLAEVKKEKMDSLLFDMELPLVRVLAEMELTGVRLDIAALNEAAADMESKMGTLEKEIFELAGEEFNVSSPAKVGEILFVKLQLDPKAKKTKTGQYTTSEDVLEKLLPKNPIVGKILEYRQMKKLLNTYLTALPAAINPVTGKVHTNYNQTVTATGRISSSSPNLQNIPVRDEMGRDIRRAFIPDPGHLFLSADYSQIELRLAADFAGDETMLEAFREGKDVHAITAAKIYHKAGPDDVTADERRHAKTANFGILYGISAFGLSTRLGIPRAEAKELIDNYFKTFPTIHKYMSDAVEFARDHGYVETKMGRKRRLPDINSKNPVVRGYAERNAINAPMQGLAADIIKTAMVTIFNRMIERGLRSRMIMQVHDELNFDVVPEELAEMQEIVVTGMESAYEGRVRLVAECGVGSDWLAAH
ncbi:MAG: DNA polymerase I [Bacteroides sp.]|nr:DNA polymerase I [Bacteroides sp.]